MRLGGAEIILIFFLLAFIGGVIVAVVFYLKNLQDLLNECDPANRQMPPSNVWLMFIPLFNIVYRFIMYPKISATLRLEFESRGVPESGDYLKGLGLAMAITGTLSVIPFQPIRSVGGLTVLVLMIIYWIKAASFKNKLRSLPKSDGVKMSSNTDLLD